MLRVSALNGDTGSITNIILHLKAKADFLTAYNCWHGSIFNQQVYVDDANQLNALLDSKADAGVLEYRDGMAIAMENEQWLLAGEESLSSTEQWQN